MQSPVGPQQAPHTTAAPRLHPQELTNTATRAVLECGQFEKLLLHPQNRYSTVSRTDERWEPRLASIHLRAPALRLPEAPPPVLTGTIR